MVADERENDASVAVCVVRVFMVVEVDCHVLRELENKFYNSGKHNVTKL